MPERLVTFGGIERTPGIYGCCICGQNPATLKLWGSQADECCLQCAFTMIADLAERSVDNRLKRTGLLPRGSRNSAEHYGAFYAASTLKCVTCRVFEPNPEPTNCSICGVRPATLRLSGALEGKFCLACACAALPLLAGKIADGSSVSPERA